MKLTQALKELENRGISSVTVDGANWHINDLIEEIGEEDMGDWSVDGDGAEQLDEEGYRTGYRYDINDDDASLIKALAGFLTLLTALHNGGYYRCEECAEIEHWLWSKKEPETAYFELVRKSMRRHKLNLPRLVYNAKEYGWGATELA